MEISQIIPHVEALIFAADRPLPLLEIVDLLNNALAFLEDRTNLDQVEAAMEAISEKYSSEFYAFEVRSSGGGYQFLTKEYYQTVAQLNGDKFLKRLSTAALETLAIIAYRQPISKGEIEYIRGVSTDYSIQKLLEKELIVITGRSEDQPGKPLLYAVSRSFMDYFGISSVADLPKLKELFDEELVQPTLISDDTATLGRGEHSTHTAETAHSLMVSEDGELLDPDHKLDDATLLTPEEEQPASEDEEVEPDDEIVRFDDIIEDVNAELGGEEEADLEEEEDDAVSAAQDIVKNKPTPWQDPGDREPDHVTDEEDPDGIVEDSITGSEINEAVLDEEATAENEAAEAEEDDEEEEEKDADDDGDKDPDDMIEDAIMNEKLLSVGGGIADEEEEEEKEEKDDKKEDEEEDDEDEGFWK